MIRISCLGTTLFCFLQPLIVNCQSHSQWQMKPVAIQTRWAKDVNPVSPLPEYPRPQMVREGNWHNLNGLWEYTITPKDAPTPLNFQGRILVPYPIESALSGVKKSLRPNENLWYRRSISVTSIKDKRTLLHFGAVDWQATVFVNGKEIGMHSGGYTAFNFDITDALKPGENELLVKVFDPTDEGIGPHGKQVLNPGNIYYTASSGIWQTVWLETVPINYIQSIEINPNVDKSILEVTVNAPTGYEVELTALTLGKALSTAKGKPGKTIELPIKNANLWSPESPFLYDLQVKLHRDGKVIDLVTSYFGMRKVSIAKDQNGIDRIFLNNKYYYNLGTLDQGFWPEGLYTAPTDSALKFDIMAIKSMGFNTIRKHIKVEPARWYYYADKFGMLVWQDLVNPNQNLPEGSKAEFEMESKDILSQLHNYPSITTWVLFNEKWGQYDQERLTQMVKYIDSSRIINGHSGEYLYVNNELRSPSPNAYIGADITDVHSYPTPEISIKQPGKAQVCGEFGGIGVPIEGHLWDDLVAGWGYDGVVTPEKMKKQYSDMVDSLVQLDKLGLSASIYTQPFDVESEQNGLITYDREIMKINIDSLYKLNHKLLTGKISVGNSHLSFKYPPTINTDYKDLKKEFYSGRKDSAFTRKVAILAERNKDTLTTKLSSQQYFNQVKDQFNEINLKFIVHFTKSTKDSTFNFLITNQKEVNNVLGKDEAEKVVTRIIEQDFIISKINSTGHPNWSEIEKYVTLEFGSLGRETLLQAQVVYAANNQDSVLFANVIRAWYENYGSHRTWISPILLNNLAWKIFKKFTDRQILLTGLAMSKKSLENSDSPSLLDTYACLLYKLGEVNEAVKWAKMAASNSNGNQELIDRVKQMESRQFNWK